MSASAFSADVLALDAPAAVERICESIRDTVHRRLKRRGVVVGLSGGIYSSVSAALCALALGAHRVFALLMP